MPFEVYEDRGALSRAFSTICLAAAAIPADVFALVVGVPFVGLSGNGGGARSGSELSHLRFTFVSNPILSSPCCVDIARWMVMSTNALYSHGNARPAATIRKGKGMLVSVARALPLHGRHVW